MAGKKVVWKFVLDKDDDQCVKIPVDHDILCVKEQNEDAVLYALVDPLSKPTSIGIKCAGTGHERADLDASKYIGTTIHLGGALIFHWFEA